MTTETMKRAALPLTDAQIAELERLEAAASSGPWFVWRGASVGAWLAKDVDGGAAIGTESTLDAGTVALIASARNALPSLLAEVRAARAASRASPDEGRLAKRLREPLVGDGIKALWSAVVYLQHDAKCSERKGAAYLCDCGMDRARDAIRLAAACFSWHETKALRSPPAPTEETREVPACVVPGGWLHAALSQSPGCPTCGQPLPSAAPPPEDSGAREQDLREMASLRAERDKARASLARVTEERDALRDELGDEHERLTAARMECGKSTAECARLREEGDAARERTIEECAALCDVKPGYALPHEARFARVDCARAIRGLRSPPPATGPAPTDMTHLQPGLTSAPINDAPWSVAPRGLATGAAPRPRCSPDQIGEPCPSAASCAWHGDPVMCSAPRSSAEDSAPRCEAVSYFGRTCEMPVGHEGPHTHRNGSVVSQWREDHHGTGRYPSTGGGK